MARSSRSLRRVDPQETACVHWTRELQRSLSRAAMHPEAGAVRGLKNGVACDPTIQLLGLHPREMKISVYTKPCMPSL